MRWKGSFLQSCWRVRYEIFVERFVFSCAECVAERVAENGIGFDVGRGRWWGGIRICGCHCWERQENYGVLSNAVNMLLGIA